MFLLRDAQYYVRFLRQVLVIILMQTSAISMSVSALMPKQMPIWPPISPVVIKQLQALRIFPHKITAYRHFMGRFYVLCIMCH